MYITQGAGQTACCRCPRVHASTRQPSTNVPLFAQQLQEGPIKDRARMERRALNTKQQANLEDYEKQKQIYAELEKTQPLTGEVVEGLDAKGLSPPKGV